MPPEVVVRTDLVWPQQRGCVTAGDRMPKNSFNRLDAAGLGDENTRPFPGTSRNGAWRRDTQAANEGRL